MKLYYSISEVGSILGVEPHTIRYWEKEFGIRPKRKGRRRVYQQDNIDELLLVKELLYEKSYTIKGAKKRYKEIRKSGETGIRNALAFIRNEIAEVMDILEG
jgi:DNA-binding transcriptional MerR regulator